MWTLQVGEGSDAGSLEFECGCVGGDILQLRLEEADLLDGNRGSEEFQRQMEIAGRDPLDAVFEGAKLADHVLDRALNFGADADRDKGADLFGRLKHAESDRCLVGEVREPPVES